MAKIADYVGAEFGPFVIDQHIASGQEADVFACTDRRTNLAYVLRLDSDDPELWRGPPLLPPRNASIERNNARGSWMGNESLWKDNVKARRRDADAIVTYAVDVFGVLDERWLIPVSAPARVKDAIDVDRLTAAVPTVEGSLVWKELCQAIAAHLEPPIVIGEESLFNALKGLASPVLLQAALGWIAFSDASPETGARAIEVLSGPPGDPPIEENILLRILVAIAREHLSVSEARACLRCRYFRANVSAAEVHQLMAAYFLVGNIAGTQSADLYGWIAGRLTEVPADDIEDAKEFRLAKTPPDVERFDLFLQSPAGDTQQPVVLNEEPDGGYQLSVGRVTLTSERE